MGAEKHQMHSVCKGRDDFRALRDGRLKYRFPEFVYAWFSADSRREASKEVHAKADEDRWGFYYGLKELDDLPEARLFYSFLAEKLHDNDATFYFHCLSIIEVS